MCVLATFTHHRMPSIESDLAAVGREFRRTERCILRLREDFMQVPSVAVDREQRYVRESPQDKFHVAWRLFEVRGTNFTIIKANIQRILFPFADSVHVAVGRFQIEMPRGLLCVEDVLRFRYNLLADAQREVFFRDDHAGGVVLSRLSHIRFAILRHRDRIGPPSSNDSCRVLAGIDWR